MVKEVILTKVIFQYSDGSIRYLEGEDSIKWSVFNEQVTLHAMVHNMNPPWEQLEWKDGKIVEHEQKNTKEESKSENTGQEN